MYNSRLALFMKQLCNQLINTVYQLINTVYQLINTVYQLINTVYQLINTIYQLISIDKHCLSKLTPVSTDIHGYF